MAPVLGVDGGGTKSHAIVAGEDGAILGFGVSGAANWEDVGIAAAGAAILSSIREALGRASLQPEEIGASVFGLAGVDFPADEVRLASVPESLGLGGPHRIVNDSMVALRAGTNLPWGVVVIAGSGSIAAGRNPDGDEFRTLGMGPMFGDWGAGTEISQAAVTAVADQVTGRGPETALAELLRERTDASSVLEMLEGLGRQRIDDSRFADLVAVAAEAGDPVSRRILEHAGTSLGASAALVARKLRMTDSEFELVMSGGMFRANSRIIPATLEATVKREAPGARPVRLEVPPVVGAVLLAMEMIGMATDVDRHTRLAVEATTALGYDPK
jgi:N-acetylglucosamine kinase-like BadF-type ATPase